MKLEILHTDETRYSKSEIDIYCRQCHGTLADIIHICENRLVTQCRNCYAVCEIETEAKVVEQ